MNIYDRNETGVQLPASADDVTLPAVAAEHAGLAEIDRYLLPAGPTAANPPHAAAAVDRWDRQTNGETDGHRIVTCTLQALSMANRVHTSTIRYVV